MDGVCENRDVSRPMTCLEHLFYSGTVAAGGDPFSDAYHQLRDSDIDVGDPCGMWGDCSG